MKREENKFDQFFRDGLRDYESPLATNLWDKLDAAREEEKNPKGIIWWKWALSASLLILLISTSFYFLTSQEKRSNITPSVKVDTQSPTTSIPQPKDIDNQANTTIAPDGVTNTVEPQNLNEAVKRHEVLETPVASAESSTKNRTVNNNLGEKTDHSLTKTETVSPMRSTETKIIENRAVNTTTTSAQLFEDKSNTAEPIALVTENDTAEKVKATQRLNFLRTNALATLDNAPDLKTIFSAPPIKIPFSWGPKGCYSFAGGRIKYDYYVDAFLAPEYVIRNLSAKTAEDENYRQRRDETETTLYGLSGGVRLSIVTRRGLALRTGIVYSRILERFNLEKEGDTRIVQVVQAGTMDTITTIETGTTVVRSYNRYRSVDIPLILGYEIEKGNFNFNINTGVYFNIFARQRGKILSQSDVPEFITSNNPQRINAFEKDLGISLFGSFGVNYRISSALQLLIEPNIRYQLKPITLASYPLEQQYINIGLMVGLRRQF